MTQAVTIYSTLHDRLAASCCFDHLTVKHHSKMISIVMRT